jgi:glutathione gamma-glutamylcysteinyltransferase
MDQFHLLALANGAEVRMRRPSDQGERLGSFRNAIVSAAEMRRRAFLVASFCRAQLGQTGSGHFSPIGAYHAASDSVLVLDVARFKYPPYWVPVRDLWRACSMADPITGRARGWFTLAAAAH